PKLSRLVDVLERILIWVNYCQELKFSKFEFRVCRGWELLELKFRFVEADELRSSTRKLRLEEIQVDN
ncbi:hypothetical protein ACMD2_21528, partial [Ananas comosus]